MSDLDKMIAAVEAGTAADFRALLTDSDNSAERAKRCGWAASAFKGSLDAAKRLHESLLPGWAAAINTNGMAQVIGPAPDWHRHTGCATDNPARAWLVAILKALRAKGAGK